jgi:Icc-related predicted phosphoesterase
MKIHFISDLHLEFDDLVLPGGDVLIMAGDICEAKHVKKDQYEVDPVQFKFEGKRHDRYIRFFVEECAKYRKVIYVMGNHEFYGGRFDKTYSVLKENIPEHVQLLEKEYVDIDGVIFVGATLWTDCNNADHLTMQILKHGMNDYRVVQNYYADKDLYFKLIPEATYADHIKAKRFIEQTAKQFADRDVVVVTHHSPSKQSIKPRYEGDYHMNGGYSSNLEELILDNPNIKAWHHGHTHDKFKYQVGDTWVLCNPRGYVGYEENASTFKVEEYELSNGKVVINDSDRN